MDNFVAGQCVELFDTSFYVVAALLFTIINGGKINF
jgi:hypothetical protein